MSGQNSRYDVELPRREVGADRIAILLEGLQHRQDRLSRRDPRLQQAEQVREALFPGIVLLLRAEHRRSDRVEVRRHEVGVFRPDAAIGERRIRREQVEPRRVDHDRVRKERLQDRVGALLLEGARVALDDLVVHVVKAGDAGNGAHGRAVPGVGQQAVDVLGRKERDVLQSRRLRQLGRREARAGRRDHRVRAEGANAGDHVRVLFADGQDDGAHGPEHGDRRAGIHARQVYGARPSAVGAGRRRSRCAVKPSQRSSGKSRNFAPSTKDASAGGASIGAGSRSGSPARTRATTRSFSSSSRLQVE